MFPTGVGMNRSMKTAAHGRMRVPHRRGEISEVADLPRVRWYRFQPRVALIWKR